jgi:alpha-glucosidase
VATDPQWWQEAIIYEVYVRSFADTDGDGVGDLRGVIDRLPYLHWLGVDAIWLTPITRSPNHDFGYDVSDYLQVEPTLGSTADLERLIGAAAAMSIRVLLDVVPNHTSVEHPWFQDPRTKLKRYVWADTPNNWRSSFQRSSWSFDPIVGRYYLHSYLSEQPDLDWWNEDVRQEFDRILRQWLERGVAGFRIDACYLLIKDRALRDNPPARPGDHSWDLNRGQRPVYSACRPELHEILRRWRRIVDEYGPDRMLLGATWVPDHARLAGFYGAHGDELHLVQNALPAYPVGSKQLSAETPVRARHRTPHGPSRGR